VLPANAPAYPLALATLLVPLTWIPEWIAQTVWFAANVAALIGALRILDNLWRETTGQAPTAPFVIRLAGVVLVLALPLHSNLAHGQVNLMVLLACCLFMRAYLTGHWLPASLWLGLASALKVTPIVFFVAPLRDRRYRVLIAAGASVVLWAVVLPWLISDRVSALYRQEWLPFITQSLQEPVSFDRQSRFTLAATLVRFWPSLAQIPGLRYWAALIVLAPPVWLQGRAGRDTRTPFVVFSLYLLSMPLLSPLSEQHHLVVLAAPIWCWVLIASDAHPLRRRDVLGAVLFVSIHWLAARKFYFLDFLVLVVLYVALILRATRPDRRANRLPSSRGAATAAT
jgi:alpha-1,2-mannosyltransferase